MPPQKSDPETFGPLLHGTARAWRLKLDQRLKPMGLSQARWRTLLHLSMSPEPLTQSEIAARLGIEEPTLVSLLHALENEGWVVRKNSSRDRRCKTVHLQRRTHRVIDRISAAAVKLRDDLIRDIPPRELQTCMRVLDQVRRRAERSNGTKKAGKS
ncbi:MAG: MarR family transcriptional regulator [Chthoniobacterales bacterium]|nr:MAG: MarR family transcriptional regulator [Chthoniobacterales bacterium]